MRDASGHTRRAALVTLLLLGSIGCAGDVGAAPDAAVAAPQGSGGSPAASGGQPAPAPIDAAMPQQTGGRAAPADAAIDAAVAIPDAGPPAPPPPPVHFEPAPGTFTAPIMLVLSPVAAGREPLRRALLHARRQPAQRRVEALHGADLGGDDHARARRRVPRRRADRAPVRELHPARRRRGGVRLEPSARDRAHARYVGAESARRRVPAGGRSVARPRRQ